MEVMKYEVVIKTDLKDSPKDHELSAALILADYFKSDVVFLRPRLDKTPDIDVNGMSWRSKAQKAKLSTITFGQLVNNH